VIDGEAVLLGADGRSDFDGLHTRQHDEKVQLYAFDMLAGATATITASCRCRCARPNLARLLARRANGIFIARRSSKVRSAPNCSGAPASWDWRVWCRSMRGGPIALVAAITGSRARTQNTRPIAACRINSKFRLGEMVKVA
jgi:hypothetical protein